MDMEYQKAQEMQEAQEEFESSLPDGEYVTPEFYENNSGGKGDD